MDASKEAVFPLMLIEVHETDVPLNARREFTDREMIFNETDLPLILDFA